MKFTGAGKLGNGRRSYFKIIFTNKLKMSHFQDNPSVGGSANKFDEENETPFKWAYEMNKTQFKYRCTCKKGYHAHGNGGDPQTLTPTEWNIEVATAGSTAGTSG